MSATNSTGRANHSLLMSFASRTPRSAATFRQRRVLRITRRNWSAQTPVARLLRHERSDARLAPSDGTPRAELFPEGTMRTRSIAAISGAVLTVLLAVPGLRGEQREPKGTW